VGFDLGARVPAAVGDDGPRRPVGLELEGDVEVLLLEQAVERGRLDVVADVPLLADDVLVVCSRDRRDDRRTHLFVLPWLVMKRPCVSYNRASVSAEDTGCYHIATRLVPAAAGSGRAQRQNSVQTGMPSVSYSPSDSTTPGTSSSETVSPTTRLGSSFPVSIIEKISSYSTGGIP
jgi:hypothetical protein